MSSLENVKIATRGGLFERLCMRVHDGVMSPSQFQAAAQYVQLPDELKAHQPQQAVGPKPSGSPGRTS